MPVIILIPSLVAAIARSLLMEAYLTALELSFLFSVDCSVINFFLTVLSHLYLAVSTDPEFAAVGRFGRSW